MGRRVTDQDIINYFVSKGAPLTDELKKQFNLPTGGITSFLDLGNQSGTGSNKYILPIVLLGSAALIYFVTKK